MCGLHAHLGLCRFVSMNSCRVVEKSVDPGCVQIDCRVKERKIQRHNTREHERREVRIDCSEDIEQSLQAGCADKGAIYFSCQMKSAFVVFPGWVSMLDFVSNA